MVIDFSQDEKVGVIFTLLQILKAGDKDNPYKQEYLDILVRKKLFIKDDDIKKLHSELASPLGLANICNNISSMNNEKKFALLVMMMKMGYLGGNVTQNIKDVGEYLIAIFNLPSQELEIAQIVNKEEIIEYYTTDTLSEEEAKEFLKRTGWV